MIAGVYAEKKRNSSRRRRDGRSRVVVVPL